MLRIVCWGSRGSVPVSGADYARHGGLTTCLEICPVEGGEAVQSPIIIDCGAGLAELARRKGEAIKAALFLQTHMHWDHLQGFPFFTPLFDGEAEFEFLSVEREGRTLREAFDAQMTRPFFPVTLEDLPAALSFESIPESGSRRFGEVAIQWDEMHHPSGSTAYRIDYGDSSFVFSGDVEVQLGGRAELVEMAAGADVLLMDGQYFPEEYGSRRGFGHSTPIDAVDIAVAAGVKRLIMTHHDPAHRDHRLDEKVAMARDYLAQQGLEDLQIDNARDGMEILLGESGPKGRDQS